jgi:putative nucleotide binding protein
METYAYVLDYLPTGRQTERGYHKEPLGLAIGESELKLLEVVPRTGSTLAPGGRIPLVPLEGALPPIDHVRRRIGYNELTSAARTELTPVLENVVLANTPRFLRFFNESEAVSRKFHLLELLPGIGKKTMLAIVEERKHGPFTSFDDLDSRVHLHHPEKLIVGRIEQELSGVDDKYRLFVAP